MAYWEIRIGSKIWLVVAETKPTIKESKVHGLEYDMVIIDELIKKPQV